LAGVGVAEGAGEPVGAGLDLCDGPPVVSDHVMMSAKGGEILGFGWPVFDPGLVVVEVAVDRVGTTGWPDTGGSL
jgi:hypothetical protein